MIESIVFMAKIRTRIAPSPTGFAHVGTAYVCLLNYAFAKKNKGAFILRIDDSDIKRHVLGAEEAIYTGLSWLGFSWDEGPDKGGEFTPYKISEKIDVYKRYATELVEQKKAYLEEGAIRFKNPGDDISWVDLIHGEVKFPGQEVTDYVMVKSDGFPTYNFATVVDDHEMQISHVIRGEEHISNTPRQIATYKAFGWDTPQFAHFPTLRNAQRKKLSKRRDPVNLALYKEEGYLPEALVNFLCLLGWSHPEGKEIFLLDEFIEKFDLGRVRVAGPIFDTQKLNWINSQYINSTPAEALAKLLRQYTSVKVTPEMAQLVKTRITKLSEADNLLIFFDKDPEASKDIFENESAIVQVSSALKALGTVKSWNLEEINSVLMDVLKEKEFKTGEFYMSIRLAITGERITPPINESMVILGQDEVLQRLERAQKVLLEISPGELDTDTE